MGKKLNVGLIGHQFMGKAHSHALKDLSFFFDLDVEPVMKVLCGIPEESVKATAEKYGWENYSTNWEAVVDDPSIDVIAIAAPGQLHNPIAVAAAKKGKHVICEKPLAMTYDEAVEMYKTAEENKVIHMVGFNYRCVPAIQLAKSLIVAGKIGKIYHFTGIYQQDWPLSEDFPYVWRFDKVAAGAGSIADKGSHIIDLARFLIGEFNEVVATTDIYIKERPVSAGSVEKKAVTTDDVAMFISKFDNGALGLFETSRMSAGRKNALSFEVNGSKGSIRFELERLNELQVYFAEEDAETQAFRTIMVTQGKHPYIDRWWPPGHIIGWEHTFIHQYYEFFQAIQNNKMTKPSFYDGMKNQEIIELLEKSTLSKSWVKVGE